jgi:hypothetical protein
MKNNKGIDYSTGLIWAAALVGMIRYAAAFLASDVGIITGVYSEWITFLLGLSGFAMGLLSTFGTAYLFDGHYLIANAHTTDEKQRHNIYGN